MSAVRIGIVGGGLMGRELAAAIGRWAALSDHPAQPRLEAVCDPNAEALAWFERIGTVRTLTDDRRRSARGPRPRRPLPRGPASPARGALPRRDRRGQGLPRREAVRDRRRGGPADRRRAGRAPGRVRALLERDALLPRRPARLRADPLGRARPDDRGPARLPALERPRPRQADQLEAPGSHLRRDRRHGRPRDARRAPAAAARLAAAQRLRGAAGHRHRAARPRRRHGPAATPGTTRRCTSTRAAFR